MPVKPIDFGTVQVPQAKPAAGPAPVAFPLSAPKAPTRQQPAQLEFKVNPNTFVLEAVEVELPASKAAASAGKPIAFAPVVKKVATTPATAFGIKRHPACDQIIVEIKQRHAALYASHSDKIDRQCEALLPLDAVTIMDWGQKALEEVRNLTQSVNILNSQIVRSNGNELIERAKASMQAGAKGWFTRITAGPAGYKPQIAVQVSNLSTWFAECNQLLVTAKKVQDKMVVRVAVISTTLDVVGIPSDLALERIVSQRRQLFQASATQASLSVQTLDTLATTITNQRLMIDQLINVTIPAFEAANIR